MRPNATSFLCCRMKPTHLSNAISFLLAASAILMTGCATAFVRSSATSFTEPVYPATVFDARILWECGVQGKPPLAPADPKQKNPPAARAAFILGSVIDFPLSIAFDTLLLPVDLVRASSPDTTQSQPDPVNDSNAEESRHSRDRPQ